jgi:hypothetical protein
VNSKQIVAAISVIVLAFIIIYPSVSTGTVSVSLASARIAAAEHVYVTIDSVWAHSTTEAIAGGWVLVSNQSATIDLVSLENSSSFLGSGQIASGSYDSVRIQVSNVTWVFNKTTTTLTVTSPEIEGPISFTVGAAKATAILITLAPHKELIANSEYFTGTITAVLTT